jgi:DNA-binding GntR family transcriptional regulator
MDCSMSPEIRMLTDDPRTLAQSVQARLSGDILADRFDPDSRLRLNPLCNVYAVGMSPLREALARLVGQRLVIQDGQRGFRVAPVSLADLEDITATRVRLERMALRDALARGNDEWEAGILAAHHRLCRNPRTSDRLVDETWEALHRKFHFALIEACGSAWLLAFCHTLYDQFDRYRRLGVREASRHPSMKNVHGKLVDAALARDAARACSILEAHIREAAAEVVAMTAPRYFRRPAVPTAGIRFASRHFANGKRGRKQSPVKQRRK